MAAVSVSQRVPQVGAVSLRVPDGPGCPAVAGAGAGAYGGEFGHGGEPFRGCVRTGIGGPLCRSADGQAPLEVTYGHTGSESRARTRGGSEHGGGAGGGGSEPETVTIPV